MNDTITQSEENSVAEGTEVPSSALPPRATHPRQQRKILMAQTFSQIIAVLMRDANFKNLRLVDLEWLVLPAIMSGQFKLGHAQVKKDKDKDDGISVPVAVALWADVSEEVNKRLSENLEGQIQIMPNEWSSGDHRWLIAAAGDKRAVGPFLKHLSKTEFNNQEVKLRTQGDDATVKIMMLAEYAA